MATTSSPQTTDLQTYILRAEDLDHNGEVDVLGTPAVIYAFEIDNESLGSSFLAMWNSGYIDWTAPEVLFRATSTTHFVIHVDNDFTFNEAVSIAQANINTGAASVVDVDVSIFAKRFPG